MQWHPIWEEPLRPLNFWACPLLHVVDFFWPILGCGQLYLTTDNIIEGVGDETLPGHLDECIQSKISAVCLV